MSNYQRVSNITYFFDLDNRSVWGEGAQLAGLTNHHQRISPFGSKNMAIGYPNISTSPCWSISIPFFDANIRCFAGSSFFCLGTTPYAMAAQPFMVTIHQYPHFLLVVPPIKNPTISWQMALFHPVSPSASGFDLGKLPLPTHVAAIPMCWWTYIPRFCCCCWKTPDGFND